MGCLRLLVVSAAVVSVSAAGGVRGAIGARRTGAIRGRVLFAEAPAPVGQRPAIGDLGGGSHEPVNRRQSVLYLESAARQAFEDLGAQHERMDQRREQFVPRVLAITVGSTVEFPNHDSTYHNVFSLSRTQTFDLGRYPPGRTGSVHFDQAGIVQVFCDIHQHMRGYILVFSHPFFALTGDDGRYTIAGVPSGTYSLAVWSELGHADSRRITVSDGGVTEVEFTIGRQP